MQDNGCRPQQGDNYRPQPSNGYRQRNSQRPQRGPNRANMVCYYCGKKGHIQSICRTRLAQQQQMSAAMPPQPMPGMHAPAYQNSYRGQDHTYQNQGNGYYRS